MFFCVHITNIISMEFPFPSEIYHVYLGYHNSPGRGEACLFISRTVAVAIERRWSLICDHLGRWKEGSFNHMPLFQPILPIFEIHSPFLIQLIHQYDWRRDIFR